LFSVLEAATIEVTKRTHMRVKWILGWGMAGGEISGKKCCILKRQIEECNSDGDVAA